MLRTKGGCRIRRSSMSLPCRPAVIFLPLPRCILWNHRQAGDRHRSTGWTGHVLHGSDHGQEGCRLGRHGSVRHQRSFDRCGAVRCGGVRLVVRCCRAGIISRLVLHRRSRRSAPLCASLPEACRAWRTGAARCECFSRAARRAAAHVAEPVSAGSRTDRSRQRVSRETDRRRTIASTHALAL